MFDIRRDLGRRRVGDRWTRWCIETGWHLGRLCAASTRTVREPDDDHLIQVLNEALTPVQPKGRVDAVRLRLRNWPKGAIAKTVGVPEKKVVDWLPETLATVLDRFRK